ncbi:PREDICTED: coiled-coil domain-containing protein 28A [Papilio polytes]|uniref:coiled-coil domain-containing protein 28A n=1 Tax=Papilio polytes TaxID=76194 RepID=UPI000675C3F7|nr:PREDICTED: coiled-coil domain-containing protein 28A [Papilio polytes]
MSLNVEEVNETQQLMQNECDEQKILSQTATSPVTSNKLSSGAASLTSRNHGPGQLFTSTGNNSVNESKLSYVNERRLHRDYVRSNYNNKPKHIPKETPDVKHMEKALLELLDDFHTGKLSAFGSGCSMEQMINIRDQQEHLARLHFRLYGDAEKPTEDGFDNSDSKDKMSQLVQSLEQLSASIEHLHSDTSANTSSSNNN